MSYTIEQKYKFLLSLFEVIDIDYWEKDAILHFTGSRGYFQFNDETTVKDVDKAIESIMSNWRSQ